VPLAQWLVQQCIFATILPLLTARIHANLLIWYKRIRSKRWLKWNSSSTEAFGQNPDPVMDPKALQQEIADKIKVNLFWAAFDFAFGEILLWTALLSSIVSAALVTLEVNRIPRWALAVLSGLLPFVLLTERVFRFTERCQWHQTYVTELQQLSHQIRDQGLDPPTVSKALDELNIRKQKEFPQRNPMALQNPK
jgi:hypothetical protein